MSKPAPGYVLPALLAKRSAFERIGTFDTELKHADKTDWFLRARDHGTAIDLLPDVLLYRRIHKNNVSRLVADDCRDEYLKLIKASLDRRRARTET